MAAITETDFRTDVRTDDVPQTGRPDCAHIVKVGPGEAADYGNTR